MVTGTSFDKEVAQGCHTLTVPGAIRILPAGADVLTVLPSVPITRDMVVPNWGGAMKNVWRSTGVADGMHWV